MTDITCDWKQILKGRIRRNCENGPTKFTESIILFLKSIYLNFYVIFYDQKHWFGIYVVTDLKTSIYVAADLKISIYVVADLKISIYVVADFKISIYVVADLKVSIYVVADLKISIYFSSVLNEWAKIVLYALRL